MERALNGVEEPFYAYGNLVGTRKRYNDRLLMFMLRNRATERFGNSVTKGGGALKGLNAVGKMEKRRLKKKWRAQWEAERANVSPQEVRASITRKIESLRLEFAAQRQREWEQMSPETRAAWERFVELRNADFERLEADENWRRLHHEGPPEHRNADPRDCQKVKPPPPKPRKTVHDLTDEGWE